MRCWTIQSLEAFDILQTTGSYFTDRLPENNTELKKAYEYAKEKYQFKHTPIFLVPETGPASFYGAAFENSIGILVDVPDELVHIQDYYNWSDIIYFVGGKEHHLEEFNEIFDLEMFPTPEAYADDVLFNSELSDERENQVMIDHLEKDWVIAVHRDVLDLIKRRTGEDYSVFFQD